MSRSPPQATEDPQQYPYGLSQLLAEGGVDNIPDDRGASAMLCLLISAAVSMLDSCSYALPVDVYAQASAVNRRSIRLHTKWLRRTQE